MNVFVTGGAGYIGSVCVEELLRAGHSVTVYDDLSEGHASAVEKRAAFVRGRVGDEPRLVEALRGCGAEVVLHFAANALVGESMANPLKYFRNNVAEGITLVTAAQAAGVRKFIFSSTCAVYGLAEVVPMTEETPIQPVNPYGASKRMLETVLEWVYQQQGMEYVLLRYFNAAGATERFGEHHRIETHLIPNVLKVALGQANECEIYGTDYPTPDGTCIRDYIHVMDLAQAHLLAMATEKVGVFNLGTGRGYSVREVIRACEAVSGQRIKAVEKPRRLGDPPRLVAAAEKARRELGWAPRFDSIEAIVSSAWEWHRRHPNGYPD